MFEIFSTREVVGAFYFILFMIFMLSKKELRAGIVKVIKCACNIKLVIPFFLLLGYISAFICIFMRTPIWNNVYIKDIVMWFLFIGVPYVYNAASDGEKKHYFVGLFLSNIKLLVHLLLDYATDSPRQGKSITDPWYSGNFAETYRDVVIGCEGFLVYLESK